MKKLWLASLLAVAIGCSVVSTAMAARYPLNTWESTGNPFWSCAVSCYHAGFDGRGSAGTAVYAPTSGIVKEATTHGGYGGTVIIEGRYNGETVCILVAHMRRSSLAVSAGQAVSEGQYLGVLGTSAENGGWPEHSHFGVRRGGYVTGYDCDNGWVFQGYAGSCVKSKWYDPMIFVPYANAHSRNGGEGLVGRPVTDFYIPRGFWIREYDGGQYGRCMLVWNGNPDQIYLVRTGFYNKYVQMGATGSSLSAPRSNEYGWYASQFGRTVARQDFNNGYMLWANNMAYVYNNSGARIASSQPAVGDDGTSVSELSLNVRPNPVQHDLTVNFSLPQRSMVNIGIFDLNGRLVVTLQDGELAAGQHAVVWNVRSRERSIKPGMYFVRMQSADRTITKKIVLAK